MGGQLGICVRSLLLDDPVGDLSIKLERFLRNVENRGPLQGAQALLSESDLWLGNLKPQFSGQILKEIKLVSWRSSRGDLVKWSGLTAPEETGGKPRLILDRNAAVRDRGQLEVRWITEPGRNSERLRAVPGDGDGRRRGIGGANAYSQRT